MSFFEDASLVLIPSAQKLSKIYSIKPTDGTGDLAFTRSNDTATRVGPDGLIEKVRTNLVLQSNSFDTTWGNVNTTETSGQSDPNGGTTAWLLTKSASTGQININVSNTGETTFSLYMKAGTSQYGVLTIGAPRVYAFFDLSAGTTGFVTSGATSSITSIGGGWYRCSVTVGYCSYVEIYQSDTNTSITGTTGTLNIWSGQVESGVMTDFIGNTTTAAVSVGPVANLPRLDYSGGATCPSLLLEPQRTNLVPNSEQFDSATWSNNGILVANQGVSPDGYTNADLFYSTTGTGKRIFDAFTITSATTYTSSVFAKASGKSFIFFSDVDNITNSVWFNLSNGTFSTPVEGTATMVDYGNGWYRCSLTTTSTSTTGYSYVGISDASGSITFTQNGTDGVLIWGAQLEEGAYETSYIPTLGAAVTRGADAASKTGISSLIGQTEGTLFVDFIASAQNQDGAAYSCITIFGSSNDNMQLYTLGATLKWYARVTAGLLFDQTANETLVAGQRYKIAYAYKSGDWALYINGVQKRTNTSSTIPATSQFNFNTDAFGAGPAKVKNEFAQALIFPTRLSNADLAALTA